jgi:hypothetical protein
MILSLWIPRRDRIRDLLYPRPRHQTFTLAFGPRFSRHSGTLAHKSGPLGPVFKAEPGG